jgi:hypothetical protein
MNITDISVNIGVWETIIETSYAYKNIMITVLVVSIMWKNNFNINNAQV